VQSVLPNHSGQVDVFYVCKSAVRVVAFKHETGNPVWKNMWSGHKRCLVNISEDQTRALLEAFFAGFPVDLTSM
jgi:hypothetical protein